jgi:hypothetical protein
MGAYMGKFAQWLKQDLPQQRYNSSFGGSYLQGFNLQYRSKNGFKKMPTKGMSAAITDESNLGTYISGKRVVAGGLLFGPLGALAGAVLRKNGNKIYVVVEQDGQVIGALEGGAKDASKAREFVAALNASANDPDNT